MPEPVLKSPVAEDVLAVTGHCCSVRLTHLPALADGIDFAPDAAARAVFAQACPGAAPAPAAADALPGTPAGPPDSGHRSD